MRTQEITRLKREVRRTLQAASWRARTGPQEDARCLWEKWQRLTAQLRAVEAKD